MTVTRALAEVITTELARERQRAALAAGQTGRAVPQTGARAVARPSLLTTPARDITQPQGEAGR